MPKARLKITRRVAIAAIAAIALYALAGFWLVPKLVVRGAHEYLEVRHHRHVEIGAVRFNPFTLRLDVERFAVADADGHALVGFGRLAAEVRIRSLLRGGVEFSVVTLDAPHLRLIERPDGTLNIMDLVPPSDPNSPMPRVWIDSLSVTHGDAEFSDQNRATPFHVAVAAFNLELDDFYTRSQANVYRLTARSQLDATFSFGGHFGLDPVVSSGELHIGNFRAQAIADAGPNLLPFDVAHGTLDLNGRYDYGMRGTTPGLALDISDLTLHDVGLRGPGQQQTWIEAPQIAVTGTRVDFQAAAASVGLVRIDGARVTAWRERDGSFNLARLYVPLPASDAAATTPPAKPWHVAVPDIRVSGADVTFTDRGPRRPATFHLAPLAFDLRGLEIPGTAALQLRLDSGVNDSGHVAVRGDIHLDPRAGQLTIEADALPLSPLQPYIDGRAALQLKSGTASFRGTSELRADGGVGIDGDGEIDGVRAIDDALEEDFVRWSRLQFSGLHVDTRPMGIRIREVIAHAPFARVIVASDGRTNLSAVLHGDEAPETPPTVAQAAAQAAAKPTPLPIEIGVVRVDGGAMNFSDFSVKPQFATGIHGLTGTIRDISSALDSRATLDLVGKVDRYAPATIAGTVNFLAATSYANVKFSFKNLELTGLSPYSGKFAGYWINKGKMSADLDYRIENRRINANHHIIVNQLTLGDRVESPDATSLPVRLGIALLKDKDGVIDLELPVTGSLDDPDFRVGKIVWQVVVNLVTKAVSSPFRLLGSLFGGGEELEFLEFRAGESTLDEATRARIASLVKALDARPGLSVDVPMGFAPDVDGAALAARRFDADLAARAVAALHAEPTESGALARLRSTPAAYQSMLESAYAETFGQKPAVPAPAKGTTTAAASASAIEWLEGALRARVTVGPRDLEDLASERAIAIQAALVEGTGIDPARVFMVKAPPQQVLDQRVRLQLALH